MGCLELPKSACPSAGHGTKSFQVSGDVFHGSATVTVTKDGSMFASFEGAAGAAPTLFSGSEMWSDSTSGSGTIGSDGVSWPQAGVGASIGFQSPVAHALCKYD